MTAPSPRSPDERASAPHGGRRRGLSLELPERRRTKIVATFGPASRAPELVAALLDAGVDVCRVNFSHGSHEQHARTIATIREAAARLPRPIAIMQDLQGPKIRTGDLAVGDAVELVDGQSFTITAREVAGTRECVSTGYADLPRDVSPGDRVLLADGALELRVDTVDRDDVRTTVVRGGRLAARQGITLPGVAIGAPAMTEKDEADLAFGVAQGVDYVALSFVRSAADVHRCRQLVERMAASTPIVAKLEKPQAIDDLEAILGAAEGVMVARGDLGVELPPEHVPLLQKRIIAGAYRHAIPVITATQMLESMIHSPRPTRAEASDVANAILDGTDAVMLSGETAVGEYPVEAVRIMDRIARAAETAGPPARPEYPDAGQTHAITRAARHLAETLKVRAIIVLTQTGRAAALMSNDHPTIPIIAVTPHEAIARRLALYWGVQAAIVPLERQTDQMLALAERTLLERGLLQPGDDVVIVGAMPVVSHARTNFMKIHSVRAPR